MLFTFILWNVFVLMIILTRVIVSREGLSVRKKSVEKCVECNVSLSESERKLRSPANQGKYPNV